MRESRNRLAVVRHLAVPVIVGALVWAGLIVGLVHVVDRPVLAKTTEPIGTTAVTDYRGGTVNMRATCSQATCTVHVRYAGDDAQQLLVLEDAAIVYVADDMAYEPLTRYGDQAWPLTVSLQPGWQATGTLEFDAPAGGHLAISFGDGFVNL